MNIVVTGASQEGTLGTAIAHALAAGGASGLLLVGSRSRPADEAAAASQGAPGPFPERSLAEAYPGLKVAYAACDLGSAEACEELMRTADALFEGQLHGLVNCAGVAFPRATLDETTPAVWARMMDVNVRAPMLLTRDASRIMRRSRIQGSIVNIGSIAAHGGAPYLSPYSVSKAALAALTKVSALELQPDRIRVNCLNIGWTLTANEDKEQAAEQGADWLSKAEATQRTGRLLRPVDISPTVGHLLSGASTMITGSVVDVSPEFIHGCLPMGTGRTDDP